jgi:DNA-binding transcriptional LysR family regulator
MATTHEELESFVTIVECGTFRSAADKLVKSQSSISYAVKSLEDELGVSLFDRNFYRPRLTPEGEIVYQKAILILSLSKDLKSISKNIASGIETKLSLMVDLIAPSEQIIKVIEIFNQAFPNTRMSFSFESADVPLAQLNAGEVDLIISNKGSNKIQFKTEAWQTIEFIPVVQDSHPLIKRKARLEDIESYNQIILDSGHDYTSEKNNHYKMTNIWNVRDFQTKKQMILRGLGWGFLPEYAIRNELKTGELKKIKYLDVMQENLYLVYPKVKASGLAFSYLRKALLASSTVLSSYPSTDCAAK